MMYPNIQGQKLTTPSQQDTLPAQAATPPPRPAAVTRQGRRCGINPPTQQGVAGNAEDTRSAELSSSRTCTRYQRGRGQRRGAVRKHQAASRTEKDISAPLQALLKPVGTVEKRFSSTQKDQFALARVECEKLQTKLLQADKGQALNALRQLQRYALVAGKGMDYKSSVQLLKYLLTDYLPGCSDKHLAASARNTVGIILDRLVRPLFIVSDFTKEEGCELARKQLLELCQERNFEPLALMQADKKELLMYYLIEQLVNSGKHDQLSGLCGLFDYEKLAERSRTEKHVPKAPWCARLYWLLATYYTRKLPAGELLAKLDRIDEEIKPVVDQCEMIKKAYLIVRCKLINLNELLDDEDALKKINQVLGELKDCPHKVIEPSKFKDLMMTSILKSKIKKLIGIGQLQEADDLLNKVSETEKKYQVKSIKTEVLKTQLKRVAIGDHLTDPKDREIIQQEIARLRQFEDKYEGAKVEIANCYSFLDDKEAAHKELKDFTGFSSDKALFRRAVLLSELKQHSESVAVLNSVPHSEYPQSWIALTTHAVTLKNWANDGYEINAKDDKVRLTEDDRKKYFLESLRLFRSAIECAPADYSGAWGGVGHLCDIQASAKLLNFQKYKRWLPEQIRHATSWRDAASKAFSVEKGQISAETARIQSGLKKTLPKESYSAAVKR
ncbi:hypothetical protein [Endozoicomonas euniceicola]|uniref:Uncharacterized protein n=1 Tax=Endozoicomonas euniceicola TaxID=1234143 RepID=A0ABY6H3J7_9GAMM|nr:hypothetical protein [Endozoicomonas euniceicola]UYM18709.1 hypothetical protein NX720_12645 [Endozoicomonas euniceicola]